MKIPTSDEIGKLSTIVTKNPLGFAVATFFLMFAFTYYININKSDEHEDYWRKQYEKERDENRELKNALMRKAGIIDYQKDVIDYQGHVIKEADSTLRKNETLQIMKKSIK